MADEFKKALGIVVVGKAIHDLDEIKKQATLQAKEAKKQTEISERMLEDAADEREKREEREDENHARLLNIEKEKAEKLIILESEKLNEVKRRSFQDGVRKFINEAEIYALTPFSGEILFQYYEKQPLGVGIKTATEILKKIAKEENLDFLVLDKDLSGTLLDGYLNELCRTYSSLDRESIKINLLDILSDCIHMSGIDFVGTLHSCLVDENEKTSLKVKKRKENEERKEKAAEVERVKENKGKIESLIFTKTFSVQKRKAKLEERKHEIAKQIEERKTGKVSFIMCLVGLAMIYVPFKLEGRMGAGSFVSIVVGGFLSWFGLAFWIDDKKSKIAYETELAATLKEIADCNKNIFSNKITDEQLSLLIDKLFTKFPSGLFIDDDVLEIHYKQILEQEIDNSIAA